MRLDWIIGIAAVLFVAVGVVSELLPKRKPPSLAFTCARCRKTTRHNARTEEAWRNGSKKLFCNACHQLWLQSRPQRILRGRSGCLGVVVLFALLPLGALLVWICA